MPSIAWSVGAGDAAGSGLRANGSFAADAVITARATVDAGASRALELQIDDVARVLLLMVSCNRYDGSVTITGGATDDPTLALTGPIVAFGAAAERLAASLGTVTVEAAADPDSPATVTFFLATSLS
jgi:hypothetical protein